MNPSGELSKKFIEVVEETKRKLDEIHGSYMKCLNEQLEEFNKLCQQNRVAIPPWSVPDCQPSTSQPSSSSRPTEESEKDRNGIWKEKCLHCLKLFSKNALKRHETRCWTKRDGNSSARYYCDYPNCNYELPKTIQSKNRIEKHIHTKHRIMDLVQIRKYIQTDQCYD